MAIRSNKNNISNITYVDEVGNDTQVNYVIARVYNKGNLLWEYENSNFFSSDKYIIVSSDKLTLNGRKE